MQPMARTAAFILLLGLSTNAFGQKMPEVSANDPQAIHPIVESAEPGTSTVGYQMSEKQIRLSLRDGTTFEIANIPETKWVPEGRLKALSKKIKLWMRNWNTYNVNLAEEMAQVDSELTKVPVDYGKQYYALDSQQKIQFEKTRRGILKAAALILRPQGLFRSSGVASEAQLKRLVPVDQSKSEMFSEMLGEAAASNAVDPIRKGFTTKVLDTLNRALLKSAERVAASNEMGFYVNVGVLAQVVLAKRGFGGAVSTGFNIGYNRELKTAIFNFTYTVEKTYLGAAATIQAVPSLGFYLAKQSRSLVNIHDVKSAAPPGLPILAYKGPTFAAAAFSVPVGLPPYPLTEVMTYVNEAKHNQVRFSFEKFRKTLFDKVNAVFKRSKCEGLLQEEPKAQIDLSAASGIRGINLPATAVVIG